MKIADSTPIAMAAIISVYSGDIICVNLKSENYMKQVIVLLNKKIS